MLTSQRHSDAVADLDTRLHWARVSSEIAAAGFEEGVPFFGHDPLGERVTELFRRGDDPADLQRAIPEIQRQLLDEEMARRRADDERRAAAFRSLLARQQPVPEGPIFDPRPPPPVFGTSPDAPDLMDDDILIVGEHDPDDPDFDSDDEGGGGGGGGGGR